MIGDIQRGAYRWKGPIVDKHQGAGLLVHKSLRCTIEDQATLEGTANRCGIVKSRKPRGPICILTIRRKVHHGRHEQIFVKVISSHRRIQAETKDAIIWTMGDFNLQGFALGHQDTQQQGSQRHLLSQWLLHLLIAKNISK